MQKITAHFRTIIIAMMMLIVAQPSIAYDFEVDGIYYNILDKSAKTVEVTYGDNKYFGSISILSSTTHNGVSYSVTEIGSFAFYNCDKLYSITIPNSITDIGISAFYNSGWYNNQPDGIIYLDNCCLGYKGDQPTGALSLKEGTRLIDDEAFYNCRELTSITIPYSVTEIGEGAFEYTSWYNNQSDGILYLDNCCLGYKGDQPTGALSLKEETRLISDEAFYNCRELTSITIPYSVTEIGEEAFNKCDALTSIEVAEENSKYDSRDNCNAIIETKTNMLITGCGGTIIPNSVTKIGKGAFSDSGVSSIIIPNSVTEIGKRAFFQCMELTSITIPNSVTEIDKEAFNCCMELTSITIPYSVTEIGEGAFYSCSALNSIIVASENEKYDSRDNCNAIIETKTNTLIVGCGSTIIPNSVTEIGNYAFYGCTGLTSISIPNSITKIGEGAFCFCAYLKSITIPKSVTTIGDYAFSYCSYLKSITIPNSVTTIGEGAFRYCYGLESIIIQNPNVKIGKDAIPEGVKVIMKYK